MSLVNAYGAAQGSYQLPTTSQSALYVIQTDMAAESAIIEMQIFC